MPRRLRWPSSCPASAFGPAASHAARVSTTFTYLQQLYNFILIHIFEYICMHNISVIFLPFFTETFQSENFASWDARWARARGPAKPAGCVGLAFKKRPFQRFQRFSRGKIFDFLLFRIHHVTCHGLLRLSFLVMHFRI